MRIAIDASIWQFQTQAGQGGSNPALRTLYYRLVRLLSLSIKPLFVFDGSNKPPFKRNIKTGSLGSQLPNFITKQLLDVFGFPYHTAPGEAEAECALLQKEGVVDAVLSEDVDTMMFGCAVHLRNWSSENVRGNKSPTHVNMYRAEITKQGKSGLDSDGMILVALMSGGDYIPAGVPGCGIKIACEAAKAGFGRDLCRLSIKDTVGFNQWRERLQYELVVNESGFFRTRHKALVIPENFPDRKVLRYYTHPAISNSEQIGRLQEGIRWDQSINLPGIRQFVTEAFDWQRLTGAKKFLRTLAPAMLVDQLCRRYNKDFLNDDMKAQEAEESQLVMMVCGRRSHWATDGVPELRIAYTPINCVALDLDAEEPDIELASLSESENEIQVDDGRERSRSPTKRGTSTYDPSQPEKIWVPESYIRFGIPLMVEIWEEAMRDPKRFASRKARERAAVKKKMGKPEFMKPGAMDAFVKAAKPGVDRSKPIKRPELLAKSFSSSTAKNCRSPVEEVTHDDVNKGTSVIGRSAPPTPKKSVSTGGPLSSSSRTSPVSKDINPWTLAKRPLETMNVKLAPGTRFSALGIYEPLSSKSSPKSIAQNDECATPNSPQSPRPTFNSSCRHRSIPNPAQVEYSEEPGTKRVNRRLDFAAESPPVRQERPSLPDSLPSPSELLSPPSKAPLDDASPSGLILLDPHKDIDKDTKRARALLALRESLNGTWRDIQPWEQNRPYIKTTYERVEIIDLTKT
ncbi:MAG: hypothetical protein LQ343_006470 [Gyalolechia ehrenbergii]|nr:MAG: hypothetical protein LQ343_006470 [Gyalolechia ehrenbergii]